MRLAPPTRTEEKGVRVAVEVTAIAIEIAQRYKDKSGHYESREKP